MPERSNSNGQMVEDRFIIIPLKQESSAVSRKVECMGGGALEVLTSLCLLVKMTLEKYGPMYVTRLKEKKSNTYMMSFHVNIELSLP